VSPYSLCFVSVCTYPIPRAPPRDIFLALAMGRMPKAADRLPAQRESVEIRALRAAITEHDAELKWADDRVRAVNSSRRASDRKVEQLEKELEQLKKEKAAGVLTELVEPRTVSAFALQAEARREEARALEEQLEAERQQERASNRAVHIRWRGKPTLHRTDADPLPKGCRVYRTAVTPAVAERALPDLQQRAEQESRPITAGQADGKRKQVKVSADEEIGLELLKALHKVGELSGRSRSEVNVLDSQPGCKRQKLHWDYDPGLVAALGRKKKKPCSVILALQSGTRLLVRDEDADENVAVPLAPGDILVFDGDVAHAGEWYASRNTRVHMYLDVDGVPREEDFTWFKRL
jgi:hypothetical protein